MIATERIIANRGRIVNQENSGIVGVGVGGFNFNNYYFIFHTKPVK
jgi:hypothetical protein